MAHKFNSHVSPLNAEILNDSASLTLTYEETQVLINALWDLHAIASPEDIAPVQPLHQKLYEKFVNLNLSQEAKWRHNKSAKDNG